MNDSKKTTLGERAIIVESVTKSFERRVVRGGYTTFKTQLVQLFKRKKYLETVQTQKLQVLRGLTFDIRRGETVGIIGENGAGKSTMLKLFTGIYRPTTGKVVHRGRVSALLELGAGFHPEFSGRENIYMNGMILGMSRKELAQKEAEIISFAELEEFIDAPVRTYSSGMYMRLAFAIAVNVNPEILIVDEILAVGDEHFQRKSQAKLDDFKKRNIAIVLVTHNLGVVENWCTRAIWLKEGRVEQDGPPRDVVAAYRKAVLAKEDTASHSQPLVRGVKAVARVQDGNVFVSAAISLCAECDSSFALKGTLTAGRSGAALAQAQSESISLSQQRVVSMNWELQWPNRALLQPLQVTIETVGPDILERHVVPVEPDPSRTGEHPAISSQWRLHHGVDVANNQKGS